MIFVRLGEILFNGAEVPTVINGGGMQMQAVHQLIGGLRVVDALGRNDADIKLSGLFRGVLSVDRVKYLDGLRVSGQQVTFAYASYNYNVIVKSFSWNLRMVYQFQYELVLTVVQDLNQPINFVIPDSFSDIIESAYTTALDLALLLNEGGIVGSLGALGIALQAAANLNSLTASEIGSITNAITNSIQSVNNVIGSLTNDS